MRLLSLVLALAPLSCEGHDMLGPGDVGYMERCSFTVGAPETLYLNWDDLKTCEKIALVAVNWCPLGDI